MASRFRQHPPPLFSMQGETLSQRAPLTAAILGLGIEAKAAGLKFHSTCSLGCVLAELPLMVTFHGHVPSLTPDTHLSIYLGWRGGRK